MATIEKIGSPFPTYRIRTDRKGTVLQPDILHTIQRMQYLSRTTSVADDTRKSRWEVIVKMDDPRHELGVRKKLLEEVLRFLAEHGAITLKKQSIASLLATVTG